LRPGELRGTAWEEFNLKCAEWRIPAARMNMRELHVVPLSTQATALLSDLHTLTGKGYYVFPSIRSKDRPISDNTINAALRRLGISADEMVAHGFRSTASTCLNELGWHPDLIELQLAHAYWTAWLESFEPNTNPCDIRKEVGIYRCQHL
jgi:integrase